MAANFLERTWFSPSWTNEEVSLTLEVIHNGDLIDWGYWVDLSNITPAQAARLHWAIDPIKWSSNNYGLGPLPDDLQGKIQRLEQWLESRATIWSLPDLVAALGEENAPDGMVKAVKDRTQLRQAEAGITNAISWNDWLNREQLTLDECLLLAMGERPDNPDNDTELWEILCGDKYREWRTEAEQWIKRGELKARKINNQGSVEHKNISPLIFFNLAMSNDWDLSEPVHEWLGIQEKQQCVTWCGEIQPIEPLTDEQKRNYNNRAAWSWVDAIYILQGYKPAHQLNTEQARSHFPDWVQYFADSLLLESIGKKTNQAGQTIYIDSPANWQAFWQSIHKRPEPKTEAVGGADRMEQGIAGADWQNDPTLTKLEKQRKAILEVIESKGFDAMAIPDGEKGTIEMLCRAEYRLFFDAESSFDTAWKNARHLFKMANHASYAKRGKQ